MIPAQSGAGASAQRQYELRSKRREDQVMAEHPRLGRLLLSLFDEPSRTKVWVQGARGERAVAAKLDELAGDHLIALHDRRMLRPDGRPSWANIDHIAITAADRVVAEAELRGACEALLANTVIEDYRIEIMDSAA